MAGLMSGSSACFTYPKVFQCENGSEFKGEVPKMLEKHGVTIQSNDTMSNDKVQVHSHLKHFMDWLQSVN